MTDLIISKEDILHGITSSATGKVMITGGYLVLERPNKGLVVSVDAQIHSYVAGLTENVLTKVTPIITSKVENISQKSFPIYLSTPQLTTEPIILTVTADVSTIGDAKISLGGMVSSNKFVSTTIRYCLMMIASMVTVECWNEYTKNGLYIYIYGDTPFYTSSNAIKGFENTQHMMKITSSSRDGSEGKEETETEAEIKQINFTHEFNPLEFQTKTGLGSSAALVSSLTSSLFSFFDLFSPQKKDIKISNLIPLYSSLSDETSFRVVYQTAQFAHCAAQGKVGSGFDVAACFYGNQTYCKFSPELLSDILSAPTEVSNDGKPPVSGSLLLEYLGPNPKIQWDDESIRFTLPRGIQIVLGDVHGGSETPSMVRSILQWRNTSPEGYTIWNKVAEANRCVEKSFQQLDLIAKENIELYTETLQLFSKIPSSTWKEVSIIDSKIPTTAQLAFIELYESLSSARKALHMMGISANVPIEPSSQTIVLDKAMCVDGVIGAGVPGAGGYDALYVLYLEDSNAHATLKKQWDDLRNECESAESAENVKGVEKIDSMKISMMNLSISRLSTVQVTPSLRVMQTYDQYQKQQQQ